ncbi:SUKH-3 domain-containing protein [Spongiactinospora sp. 9N601]|uniref:SUKH-3 domain-containing protein n=1 Tax=Spongiactinospora sp. 9N601 TaxID=3375149 RepID=UPI0037B54078
MMPEIAFSALHPEVLSALRAAGWTPGRKVATVSWVEPLARAGHVVSPLAEAVLASLGGLVIQPAAGGESCFLNGEPFSVDPLAAGSGQRAMGMAIESMLGGSYFPIAEWLSYSSVFLEAGGRMVACGLGWIWELGGTFEEGLELAVRAHRPLVCLHADPGLDPWP